MFQSQKIKEDHLIGPNEHTKRRNFKDSLDSAERRLFALKYKYDDNYWTSPQVLVHIYEKVRWKPWIDICTDVLGINSSAPFYYDAMSDGTLQAENLAGMHIMCNPPYYRSDEFIETLEQAYEICPETRAILIVPAREKQDWFIYLTLSPHWTLVSKYSIQANVFT